jgi:hypothetical protein
MSTKRFYLAILFINFFLGSNIRKHGQMFFLKFTRCYMTRFIHTNSDIALLKLKYSNYLNYCIITCHSLKMNLREKKLFYSHIYYQMYIGVNQTNGNYSSCYFLLSAPSMWKITAYFLT